MTETIRLAHAADLDGIRAVARDAFTQYIEAMGREPAPMGADFADEIARGLIHVLSRDDAVIGYITFFAEGDHLQLDTVALLGSETGKGLGRRLIDFCEATARDRGLRAIELYTNEKMAANLALYPRLGYRETERRTEKGFNRVFFRKEL